MAVFMFRRGLPSIIMNLLISFYIWGILFFRLLFAIIMIHHDDDLPAGDKGL